MWRYAKSKLYGVGLLLLAAVILTPAVASAAVKIQTSICGDFTAPTIVSPVSGFVTQNDSVIITGEGDVSLPVTIIENNMPVATTEVSTAGDYSVSIPLAEGNNAIVAQETNGCGTVKKSDLITVSMNASVQPKQDVVEPSASNPEATLAAPILPLPSVMLDQPIPTQPNTRGFKAPSITQPVSGATYTVNKIWVAGNAEPSSTVTVYVDGKSIARVQASPIGGFGVVIELHTGVNTIEVSDEKDGKLALSKTVTVMYVPQKPTKTEPSPIVVAVTAAAVTVTAAAATSGGVWAVKFINAKRLR